MLPRPSWAGNRLVRLAKRSAWSASWSCPFQYACTLRLVSVSCQKTDRSDRLKGVGTLKEQLSVASLPCSATTGCSGTYTSIRATRDGVGHISDKTILCFNLLLGKKLTGKLPTTGKYMKYTSCFLQSSQLFSLHCVNVICQTSLICQPDSLK